MALFRSCGLHPTAFGALANARNIVPVFQFTNNIGYDLNREANSPGDIDLCEWPMLAYGFKHNSPIVRPPKVLVRSP